LVATVATIATGSTIAFKVDVLHHLVGGIINFKIQGSWSFVVSAPPLILTMSTSG
jgi:hypothetical protein